MKEATGELNMTVITLVAITAIAAVFYFVVYPLVQRALVNQTCVSAYGSNYFASDKASDGNGNCTPASTNQKTDTGNSTTEVIKWYCCEKAANNGGTVTPNGGTVTPP